MSFIDICKGAFEVTKEYAKAHLPEICEVSAGVLSAAAIITAVKAGRKITEERIIDNFHEELDEIDNEMNTNAVGRGGKKIAATAKVTGRLGKKLILPVLLQTGAVVVNHYGYGTLRTKVALLGVALAEASANQKQILDNVYGAAESKEEADAMVTGGKYESLVETIEDEAGNEVDVGSEILVTDIDKLPMNMIVYAKSTVKGDPLLDDLHFATLIEHMKANAERILDGYKHHVFLNEALKPLNMEQTDRAYYRTHGSIKPTTRQLADGGDKNLGKFDILYRPILLRHPDDSVEKGWLINVVCDGAIINTYEKYLF